MAYLARQDILYAEAYFHVTWQCHNREWFLEPDLAKELYYSLLLKYKERYGVQIYSYSFMDNHPHLTGKTETQYGISNLMKLVNSLFAKKVNQLKERRGQVVMDRFKSPVIQTGSALLRVMSYGDMNAVRAGKVKHPKEYRWCSYRYYAYGEPDSLITPSPAFLELSQDLKECQKIYRDMAEDLLQEEGLKKQDYSTVSYIGDPAWVKERYDRLQEIKRIKRQAYLQRQKQFLYNPAPS